MNQATQAALDSDAAVQIAEYVCGLLGAEERAYVHDRLSHDDHALKQALAWEDSFLALVDALPRVQPPSSIRERLQNTLGIGPPPPLQPPPQPVLLQRESAPAPVKHAGDSAPTSVVHSRESAPAAAMHSRELRPAPSTQKRPATQREQTAASNVRKPGEPTAAPDTRKPGETTRARAKAKPDETTRARAASKPDEAPGADAVEREDEQKKRRILVRKLWFWRLIGLCSTAAAIVGIMLPGTPPPPPVQVIKVAPTRAAILQAPGTSSTPAWTATLDPHGNLVMQPLVRTEIRAGSQALLWTRSERVPEPRLLGRIDPNRPVQVPAATLGALAEDQILEITEERDEDAAKGVPQGPILFIGQMTVFGSDAASAGTQRGAVGSGSE